MTANQRTPPADRPEFAWDSVRLRLSWANDAGLRFWGEDSLIDLTESVFSPGDETVRALAAREAEMIAGASVGRVMLYPQGDPVWALADCRAERRTDGRMLMRVGLDDIKTVHDDTLMRKRAGFDAALRPMVIFDQHGVALLRNEADRRAYPLADDTIEARYSEPDIGHRALTRALADGAYSHTASIESASGSLRHRISLQRMRDPVTGALCAIADFTDLSDRPALSGAVDATAPSDGEQSMVSVEALARIAHDVRAPLGAISGFAEMLRVMGDALPEDRRTGALADIEAACARLTALTDRIVGLGGGGNLQLVTVDLAKVCEDAARLFAAEAKGAGLSLHVDTAHRAEVLADQGAVTRIIDNLMRNALSHGWSKGGVITLSFGGGHGGEAAWFEVSDDGPGLLPQQVAAALEAYRADGGPRSTNAPLLHGLGLANVMTLAQEMAAHVSIKSEPGKGFAARVIFAVSNGAAAPNH